MGLFGFSYENKKKQRYWLHQKKGRGGTILYYFSKDPNDAIDKPSDFEVVESKTTGLPVLRKKKKST